MGVKFIKKISKEIMVPEVLTKLLINTEPPEIYNEEKTYSKDDLCLVIEGDEYVVKVCNEDNVTGTYDSLKWSQYKSFREGLDLGTF